MQETFNLKISWNILWILNSAIALRESGFTCKTFFFFISELCFRLLSERLYLLFFGMTFPEANRREQLWLGDHSGSTSH